MGFGEDDMSEASANMRASGDYATYGGREYFAELTRDHVWLYVTDDPPPPGFTTSSYSWVSGEKSVSREDLQQLTKVSTTCSWRGHRFQVGIIVGDSANIAYLGKHFDQVSPLPGMRRPDKYEVRGRAPVSELTDVEEHVDEVPLGDKPSDDTPKGDHR